MRIVIVRHIPINYWLIGVLKLNILQVMWLWQFQNFTNKKPCLQHGFTRIALGWDAQWCIKSENTRFKHQRPQTAALW